MYKYCCFGGCITLPPTRLLTHLGLTQAPDSCTPRSRLNSEIAITSQWVSENWHPTKTNKTTNTDYRKLPSNMLHTVMCKGQMYHV